MIYVKGDTKKILEEGILIDTNKNYEEFMKIVLETVKKDVDDEIRQSITKRCNWFLNRLISNPSELQEITNKCNVKFEVKDNKIETYLDGEKLEGATKALITVLTIAYNKANITCKSKDTDKLIRKFADLLYKEFREDLAASTYPIKIEYIDKLKCSSDNPYAKIAKALVGKIVITPQFDKYEMSLGLLLIRFLENSKSCLQYLYALLTKMDTELNIDVPLNDLKLMLGK